MGLDNDYPNVGANIAARICHTNVTVLPYNDVHAVRTNRNIYGSFIIEISQPLDEPAVSWYISTRRKRVPALASA